MITRRNIVTWLVIGLALFVILIVAFLKRSDFQGTSLKFASLIPLDGQVAAYGEMMRNGQSMAVEDINSDPENTTKLKIIFYNTSHQKDVALDRLKEAVNDGIQFVVEIFGSDQLDHCLQYSLDHNLMVVSGVDTRPDLVSNGKGAFFRLMPNDNSAASFLLQWAKESGVKRIGIVYANDDWGEGLRDAAFREAHQLGIEIVSSRDISRHQISCAATVSELKVSSPNGILLFVYPDDGGNFLKEARRQQLDAKFYGTENFAGKDMVSIAKSSAKGVMMVSPAAPEGKILFDFKKRYKSRFGIDPTIFALKGYDAVRFLYEVAIRSRKDSKQARQYAKSYKGTGLTGTIAFDKSGEFIAGRYERLKFVPSADTFEAERVNQ